MIDQESMFRREAWEFHTREREPDRVLRVALPWVRWLYRGVLALLALGLVLGLTIKVNESGWGPALVDADDGSFVMVLPAGMAGQLEPDARVRVTVEHPSIADLAGEVLYTEPASAAEARRAGFEDVPEPAVLLTGALTDPWPESGAGVPASPWEARAEVVVRSDRLLTALLRGITQGGDG